MYVAPNSVVEWLGWCWICDYVVYSIDGWSEERSCSLHWFGLWLLVTGLWFLVTGMNFSRMVIGSSSELILYNNCSPIFQRSPVQLLKHLGDASLTLIIPFHKASCFPLHWFEGWNVLLVALSSRDPKLCMNTLRLVLQWKYKPVVWHFQGICRGYVVRSWVISEPCWWLCWCVDPSPSWKRIPHQGWFSTCWRSVPIIL